MTIPKKAPTQTFKPVTLLPKKVIESISNQITKNYTNPSSNLINHKNNYKKISYNYIQVPNYKLSIYCKNIKFNHSMIYTCMINICRKGKEVTVGCCMAIIILV
jgi:hypothetical protein